ncbi:type II secretion system protein [Paraburkholderia rhizosphaerae]|uniref:Type II secretory pathway pseudopilin PulG n=1 Tax=Paraburkholderia rhizosphaerae TaxID=480658 RepID=A0A4R8LIG0_9BURK|nr:type II secretion system protein [Paraburkholderia rhizosphaerae]TDY43010.1 type II secretory pathway pseudopilin PulG [Paraburkholderia rhizosphaerae]
MRNIRLRGARGGHRRTGTRKRGTAGRLAAGQRGFAYLALLIVIAIIAVTAAAQIELGAVYQRRMAEEELLATGHEFQRALLSYANATPLGQPNQPRTLQDLVRDPRYPNVVRHLRKVYADPMTGKDDWVLIRSPDGQTIVGLHSASTAHPIQIAHFAAEFRGFEDKQSYMDWVFVARTPALTQGGRPPAAGDGATSGLQNGGMTPTDGMSFPAAGAPLSGGSGSGGPIGSSPFGNLPGGSLPSNSPLSGGLPGSLPGGSFGNHSP